MIDTQFVELAEENDLCVEVTPTGAVVYTRRDIMEIDSVIVRLYGRPNDPAVAVVCESPEAAIALARRCLRQIR